MIYIIISKMLHHHFKLILIGCDNSFSSEVFLSSSNINIKMHQKFLFSKTQQLIILMREIGLKKKNHS